MGGLGGKKGINTRGKEKVGKGLLVQRGGGQEFDCGSLLSWNSAFC
jgi:hypothetical protein